MKSTFLDCPIDVSSELAHGLLQIRAVQLRPESPFTWSSGWKSPIYCDNRLVLSYPVLRTLIIDGFEAIVRDGLPGVEMISGAATGGIAHAALLSERFGLPMTYVRGSAKDHGTRRRVEGRVLPGVKTLVIEDTLSTGKSAYEVVSALQDEGAEVLAVLSIFSYDFDVAREKAREFDVPTYRLLNYDKLIDVAVERGYVEDSVRDTLLQWREAPDQWG